MSNEKTNSDLWEITSTIEDSKLRLLIGRDGVRGNELILQTLIEEIEAYPSDAVLPSHYVEEILLKLNVILGSMGKSVDNLNESYLQMGELMEVSHRKWREEQALNEEDK